MRQCSWPSGVHQFRNEACTRCGALNPKRANTWRVVDVNDVATEHDTREGAEEQVSDLIGKGEAFILLEVTPDGLQYVRDPRPRPVSKIDL